MTLWEFLSKILLTRRASIFFSLLALVSLTSIGGFGYLAYQVAEPGTEVSILGVVKFTKLKTKLPAEPLPATEATPPVSDTSTDPPQSASMDKDRQGADRAADAHPAAPAAESVAVPAAEPGILDAANPAEEKIRADIQAQNPTSPAWEIESKIAEAIADYRARQKK